MSGSMQFHSRDGDDGVLHVDLNLRPAEAAKEFIVTIAPLTPGGETDAATDMSWADFIARTYGSCAGLGLERPRRLRD